MEGGAMYKIDIDFKRLRSGEEVRCPECKEGVLQTEHDPQISHHFECDKCGLQINID